MASKISTPRSIAFYVRVSTISQDFPSQMHALKEYCRRQGWPVPPKAKIFAEKISGKLARRTQLDRLLQACRDGVVDTVMLYRVDRMGNSFVHLVNIQAELDALKIRVIGVADNLDTAINNAAANHYRNTLNAAAQFNREIISERTLSGLAAARDQGRVGGRPRTSDDKIARALKLKSTGKTHTAIAKISGLSKSYISKIFSGDRKSH
jgi:DNA invertase Pin-like site-specific DNA recombinase